MKRINYILNIAFAGVLGLSMTACTDGNDWDTDGSFSRLFGVDAKNISVEAEETQATVSFSTIQGAEYYVMEFSTDTLYNDIEPGGPKAMLVGTDGSIKKSPVVVTGLAGDTKYYMRMKAVANGKADSKWVYYREGKTFRTKAEQIFNEIPAEDRSEDRIRLSWMSNAEVTSITVRQNEELLDSIILTDTDKAAAEYTVTQLNPSTTYVFTIFNGEAKRGQLTASTTAAWPAADFKYMLDEGVTVITTDLLNEIATMAQEAAGSAVSYSATIGIPAGTTIDIHGTSETDGSATSVKIPDGMSVTFFGMAGGDAPVINLSKSIGLDGSHAFIRFENVNVTNGGCDYLINQSTGCTVGTLEFKDFVMTDMPRSLVRLQSAPPKTIENLIIDNSIITNQGDGYALLYFKETPYTVRNITVKNSTFSTLKHNFIQCPNATVEKIDITDCTFYNIIGGGRYLIDAQGLNVTTNISNTIFAKTNSETAKGIRTDGAVNFSNSYMTSDFVLSSNKFTTDMTFEGTADDLFADPANGDFTLKAFINAGDPRWIKSE